MLFISWEATVVCILKGKNCTQGLKYGMRLQGNGQTQDQGQSFFPEISLSNWEIIITIIIIIIITLFKSQWI